MATIRAKPHRLPLSAYRGEKTVAFTCCIDHRKRAFVSPKVVEPMVEMLVDALSKFECIAPVYCFMPDHFHAIVRGTLPRSNAKTAIDSFKSTSGQWLSQNAPRFSWQESYHDHIVRKAEDLRNQVRYVAANPIRAGLVEEMLDYPFLGSIGCDLVEFLQDLGESERFGRP